MPAPMLEVAYRACAILGDDFFIFVRPRGIETIADTDLRNGVLRCSWRRGNGYLVYDQALRPYGQDLVRGEWTALGLPWPQVSGLLTFELTLLSHVSPGAPVASGEVLSAPYPRITAGNGWVYAWSPSGDDALIQPARTQLAKHVSLRHAGEAEDGEVELWVLSVGLPSVAPPETIEFERFPYQYGSARDRCVVPHGPGNRTDFLLPVSRPATPHNTVYRLGSMGGYARSPTGPLLPLEEAR